MRPPPTTWRSGDPGDPGRDPRDQGQPHHNSEDFARYYNLRKRSCGHVWQARYHSTPLDASLIFGGRWLQLGGPRIPGQSRVLFGRLVWGHSSNEEVAPGGKQTRRIANARCQPAVLKFGKLSPINSITISTTKAALPTAQTGHLIHEISGPRMP